MFEGIVIKKMEGLTAGRIRAEATGFLRWCLDFGAGLHREARRGLRSALGTCQNSRFVKPPSSPRDRAQERAMITMFEGRFRPLPQIN
jgi:hypothetical protein